MNRITLTPSEASPDETLYVDMPKLADNVVLVPGSVYLTFDLNVTGHANNTLVNNVGKNLVKRQRVLFGGEVLQETLSLAGRGGSRAPKRYVFLSYIFISLKVSTKRICMFPSQIIVQIDVSAA